MLLFHIQDIKFLVFMQSMNIKKLFKLLLQHKLGKPLNSLKLKDWKRYKIKDFQFGKEMTIKFFIKLFF